MTKTQLRKILLDARVGLSEEEAARLSRKVTDNLLALEEMRTAASVFVYVSEAKEVDTHGLIRELLSRGVIVAVPWIIAGGLMEAHTIESFDDLAPGPFKILAPRRRKLFEGSPDVTICPGVAFTPEGARLGRGGGYYDRFLAAHPSTVSIGPCFEFQLVGEMPQATLDRRVGLIVTESRVLRL
jgi:5-formyltetrahydrofolate cyclo-ligase